MNSQQLKRNIAELNKGIVDVPYERPLVEAVDKLLEMTRKAGYSNTVETEEHWKIIEKAAQMWAALYPEDYEAYKKKQLQQKSLQNNKYASASEKGGAQIRHLAEIPAVFYKMIIAVFPDQPFDKKFATELSKRMPLLRWAQTV